MLCLAIETSCDDTSVAILEYSNSLNFEDICNNTRVLSMVVSSQISVHENYGGVIPELGARLHTTNFQHVLIEAIEKAVVELKITLDEFWIRLNIIAVTSEPGLSSALKVGLEEAKALKYYINNICNNNVEIIKVNHLKGHIASAFLSKDELVTNPFPHLHLLVSGGNTQMIKLTSWLDSEIIGKTVDDAVGECYDKTARMLGFKYPGGVSLAKTAGMESGNYFKLNKAMVNDSLNLSFSGLKTQIRYLVQKAKIEGLEYDKNLEPYELDTLTKPNLEDNLSDLSPKLEFITNMCISIQTICTEQMVRKFKLALKKDLYRTIGVSGGVSANLMLRTSLSDLKLKLYTPSLKLTGDNAAMIGLAGILDHLHKN